MSELFFNILLVGCLMQDTVIDAGIFDGALGIVTAISALKVLKLRGMLENLKRPVEVTTLPLSRSLDAFDDMR